MNRRLQLLYKNAGIVDDVIAKLKDPAIAGGTVGAIAGGVGGAVTSPENASKLETVLRILLGAGAVGAGGYAAGSAMSAPPKAEPPSAEERARDRKALESRSAARTEDVGKRVGKAKGSTLPGYGTAAAATAAAGATGKAARDLSPVLKDLARDRADTSVIAGFPEELARNRVANEARALPLWERPAYRLLAKVLIRK